MHTPGTPDISFAAFYAVASRTVWTTSATTRSRMFHGGRPCEQAGPPALEGERRASENATSCADCSSFHAQTVWVIGEKFRRKSAEGNRLDPVRFAKANAKDRFEDTVMKEDGAAYGVIQKPRRTVDDSLWINAALDGDDDAKQLLYLYLRFVQGHDPVEAGSPLPYQRWAAKLGMPHQTTFVENWLAEIIDRLRRAKPSWVEQNLDAHTRHLTGHAIIDNGTSALDDGNPVADQLRDARVAIGDDDHLEVALATTTLTLAIAHPLATSRPDQALNETIIRTCGTAAANRARRHPDWPVLTGHVGREASRDAA